jgi:aspartate aminotransferase
LRGKSADPRCAGDERRSGGGSRGKPIIFFSLLALADRGDEVIYPNPGFPIYESMINYLGAKAVPVRLREEKDFSLDADELAALITDRTKLIILNSPQNPTGGVISRKDIQDIAEAIGDRNIMVCPTRYCRLIFEGEHYSIMSVPGFKERTILMDGFSETYCNDGMADGIWCDALGSGNAGHALDDEFQFVHG